jgi:hypothetical protein
VKVAMVRIGVDTGTGGIYGPLFKDGSFEYIPIPDGFGIDARTYGNTKGRMGEKLLEYFPRSRQTRLKNQSIHLDPEFTTFTYGDPTPPKAGLRRLKEGDLLVFYCGLEGWDVRAEPALYLIGYFEVKTAGYARDYSTDEQQALFGGNFHVRHKSVYRDQKDRLVLVKGNSNSRLLDRAVLMSDWGEDKAGRPLKVLSTEMQQIFGNFDGKISFQRSPTRWVLPDFVERAAAFMRSLA